MNRTIFLIDGFNLYHSVVTASNDLGLGGKGTKWLDIDALCRSYLYLIGGNAQLEKIYYFSALATHLADMHKVERHKLFIKCLESKGIQVILGRFKEKKIYCYLCKNTLIRHEEKETDVAISIKLIEVLLKDECDSVVLITGDTDIAPAVRMANTIFSDKKIYFGFPYKRKNRELSAIAPDSFEISKEKYVQHQFPKVVKLPHGREIHKPADW